MNWLGGVAFISVVFLKRLHFAALLVITVSDIYLFGFFVSLKISFVSKNPKLHCPFRPQYSIFVFLISFVLMDITDDFSLLEKRNWLR